MGCNEVEVSYAIECIEVCQFFQCYCYLRWDFGGVNTIYEMTLISELCGQGSSWHAALGNIFMVTLLFIVGHNFGPGNESTQASQRDGIILGGLLFLLVAHGLQLK